MLTILWHGLLLGWGAAIPIGPVNVEIARRALRGGFRAGFLLGMGAVTVDVVYAVVVGVAVVRVMDHRPLQLALAVAGALVLGYLGVGSLRSAGREMKQTGDAPGRPGNLGRHYITGVLMTAVNPMTLVFWFVAVPASAAGMAGGGRGLPAVCAGVFLAALSWVIFFASLMHLAGRRSKRVTFVAADLAGGVILLGLAGWGIWRAWGIWRVEAIPL